jgi:carbonic anhydrase
MSFPEALIKGYRTFLQGRLSVEQTRYRELAENGQSPQTMVIGCCDSRVSPEVIFDAHPGELFVVRNVANLVPPYTPDGASRAVSAALEFAVQALKVRHIVVLGHARCGGVRAFADGEAPLSAGDFIGKWMELIAPAAETIGPRHRHGSLAEYLTRLEQASIVKTLANLATFPWIAGPVSARKLELHGAYFDVATGLLLVRDPATGTFASIAGASHSRVFSQPRF